MREGELVHDNLRKTRIFQRELLSQLRAKGKEDLKQVRAAYLEPNGQVTFLFQEGEGGTRH